MTLPGLAGDEARETMMRVGGGWKRPGGLVRAAGLATLVAVAAGLPAPARAQFFWSGPRFSADDAARVAIRLGYNVLQRPARSDDVYVAEIVDRRGNRGRLIVSAETGEILQRFWYQSRGYRRDVDPTIPPGPVPPARIPEEDRRPGFFAKLFGNDESDDRRPQYNRPDRPPIPEDEARPRNRTRASRAAVEQAPLEVPRPAPVESRPLAPATAAPSLPARVSPPKPATPAPAQASLPPATATPPAPAQPGRSISTNPLAIPGSREQDEKTAKPAEAKVEPTKPTEAAKPKPATVPVAPLE